MEEEKEKFCWVCRFCGLEGPYQTDLETIPKKWIDDERGLRCPECKDREY